MNLDDPHTITGAAHPTTSHEAAAGVHLTTGTARRRVLELLAGRPAGYTDEQMQAMLRMSPNSQRPRRIELLRAGYIRDSGRFNLTLSGNRSIVWEITDTGRRALLAAL